MTFHNKTEECLEPCVPTDCHSQEFHDIGVVIT
ncbi:hypothetical protein GBAR_LOCUS8405 [Geodia barretti]|uniref:Uncharacterized protein n=1 Tax=Geodia barretti TaxID=519541 RepID=A0AA35RN99_GEOBA|nr:hypothetical protein GBAR_LOCUS8405 [Geodia barretti]